VQWEALEGSDIIRLISQKDHFDQAWRCTPVISALEMLRQED
jgi:hypothetical protein